MYPFTILCLFPFLADESSSSVSPSKTVGADTSPDDKSQNASEGEDIVRTVPDIKAVLEGQPMDPSLQESLAVSASWAILNGNSEGNSPHLSPISSEGSVGRVAEESDSMNQNKDIEMSGYESISSDITESTGITVSTVKILKFGTPQTIAIIVLEIEKFDLTLH